MDAYSPDGNCRHRPSVDQMGGPWEASTCFHNPEWKVARIEERRKRNVRKPIHKNIRVHTHGRRHAGRQAGRQAGRYTGRQVRMQAGTQARREMGTKRGIGPWDVRARIVVALRRARWCSGTRRSDSPR